MRVGKMKLIQSDLNLNSKGYQMLIAVVAKRWSYRSLWENGFLT